MDIQEGIPLHKQISDWLRNQVNDGSLKKNEKLPSENELSDFFNVSRVTVRRALQTLENEQLIYRCQGVGSFVSDNRTHQSFTELKDFEEELSGAGLQASSKVISFKQEKVTPEICSYLGVKENAIVVKLERVRLGNGQPIAYDITWLPVFYGQLIDGYDLQETTLFKILENEFEIPVDNGCYRLEAAVADASLASQLEIEKHTPVLLINRISYTFGNKPVYFQKRYYRNDRMIFEIRTERRNSDVKKQNLTAVSKLHSSVNI
ncbi:MAG: GntR family transcriptional regulator [Balneola sp.]|jgi:GntR family transcriptional regulator|nr:GntR family transcriptional regulator [Balneola sp.]MBE78328.1 GntR family transcriptional regulator [Balneola sp.]HBX65118.1 GntR family transcriptional regulator [Balneolaceae bacterium]|tara:strand:+ start:1067 stop:1855 length:789 start_codon:yes stop_codon:yes gene_type:complete